MKSRMTITTMLVVGMLMSMSGAGLALSGPSADGSAAGVQYQSETNNSTPVTPATPATPATPTPASAVAPAAAEADTSSTTPAETPAEPEVKAAQQVAAAEPSKESGSLPFTGYSALPILVGGLVVLMFGMALRRQTRRDAA